MFPLGSVLLPSMALPLHVFEDRYRVMVDRVLRSDPPEFGVVLIERGSEVGGGDVRVDVGCTARVVEARPSPDGRWALLCVGDRRIRVTGWLDDDPYPAAVTEDWPDADVDGTPPLLDLDRLAPALADVETRVRRVAALGTELGAPGLPEPLELSDDPVLRSYQFGVLAPVGPLDRLAVLAAPGVTDRLDVLTALLADQESLLRARIELGAD